VRKQQRQEYIKDLERLESEIENYICDECKGGTCNACFADYKNNLKSKISKLKEKYNDKK